MWPEYCISSYLSVVTIFSCNQFWEAHLTDNNTNHMLGIDGTESLF